MMPSRVRIVTDVARRKFKQGRGVQPRGDDWPRQNDGALAGETFSDAGLLISLHGVKDIRASYMLSSIRPIPPWTAVREDTWPFEER
jgi:hypothetical protein